MSKKLYCLNYLKILVFAIFAQPTCFAKIIEYKTPELLARSNVEESYNLPPMSFLFESAPIINNLGDVSLKLILPPNHENDSESEEKNTNADIGADNVEAIWFKKFDDLKGEVVFITKSGERISEMDQNDQRSLIFNLYRSNGDYHGLWQFDIEDKELKEVTTGKFSAITYLNYPQLKNDGRIYFRGTGQSDDRKYFEWSHNELRRLIGEGELLDQKRSSYLFRPSFNESGNMSFKRRVGENGDWTEKKPDEILLLRPIGQENPDDLEFDPIVIARDLDADPHSEFLGFLNVTSLANNDRVAFIGILPDNKKAIYTYANGGIVKVAKDGENGIFEIEGQSLKQNMFGQVLFLAKNVEGKRGIYLADHEEVKKIIEEDSEVPTDLGMGKILFNPNFSGIHGEVDMNESGDIVFSAYVVSDKDIKKEWGQAVYVIKVQMANDNFNNGN